MREERSWKDLPEKIDFDDRKQGWGWGKYEDMQWFISQTVAHPTDPLHDVLEIMYRLPESIGRILNRTRVHGAEEAKKEIRAALGCK